MLAVAELVKKFSAFTEFVVIIVFIAAQLVGRWTQHRT
jgi:hypothetical protein